MLLKAVFRFLNTFAGLNSQRLNVIFFFLCKSAFGLVVLFYNPQLFSLSGRLSLFSVKLCFTQKFEIDIMQSLFNNIHGYTKYTTTHSSTTFLSAIL